MTNKTYISWEPRLLKNFDRSISRLKQTLTSRYGEEQANKLIKDSRVEYEILIPQIPYIGDKNPFLIFLLPTVKCLAIYKALLKQGSNVEEAGKIIYVMSESEFKAIPKLVRRLISYIWFSPWFIWRLKRRAKKSQEREYPDSFVMHFIEGDKQNFDYGIDYTECANCKFLSAQNALELAPYICATDKVASELLGWGLQRTTTLAYGKNKCDFRFKKGGITSIESPSSI